MAKQHYINNATFLQNIINYKLECQVAKAAGEPKPKIPEYIGECIFKIANRLSTNYRFHQYTFKDEMINDGIENCIQYFDNFDPEKSKNPFAYYTQIIWYAFIRRIQREKKQSLIKGKILQEMPYDAFDLQEHDQDSHTGAAELYLETMRTSGAFNDVVVKDEERRLKKKKAREPVVAALDDIIEEVVSYVEHLGEEPPDRGDGE